MARFYQSYSAYHVTEVGYDDLVYRSILGFNNVKVHGVDKKFNKS